MPNDAEARRQAALDDLRHAITALSRAVVHIAEAPVSVAERRLLRVMTSELARARRAAQILDRG